MSARLIPDVWMHTDSPLQWICADRILEPGPLPASHVLIGPF